MKKNKSIFLILCMICILFLGVSVFASAAVSPISFTDTDADHIYFAGDTLGFSFDTGTTPGLPANTPVVAEFYIMCKDAQGAATSTKTALLTSCDATTMRVLCDTSVTNTISVSGTIAAGLDTGVVGVKFFIGGTVASAVDGNDVLGSVIPIANVSNQTALVGLDNVLPTGITADPVFSAIPNFFADNLGITFSKDLGGDKVGKIAFKDLDLTTAADLQQFANLETGLNISQDASPATGTTAQFGFGINDATLAFLASKGATISMTSATLFDGKTAADFNAINGENSATVSFDDATDTASFTVEHFSDWTLSLLTPTGGIPGPGMQNDIMQQVSFTKLDAAGTPATLPFVIGSGAAVPTLPTFTPKAGIDFTGLLVDESDYEISSDAKPCVKLNFPTPKSQGATSYTLQYSANGTDGWANYKQDNTVVTTPDDNAYFFYIYPTGSFYYRLASNANKYSNVVYAPLANQVTDFRSWTFDESWNLGTAMSPYVGCGMNVSGITVMDGTLSYVANITSHLSYEWYQLNPLTYEMTKIDGATSDTYVTKNADMGYYILCKVPGDGITVGGYWQIRANNIISFPVIAYISNLTDDGFTLNLKNPIALTASDVVLSNGTTPIPITALTEIGDGATDNAIYHVAADLSTTSFDAQLTLKSTRMGLTIGTLFNPNSNTINETDPGLAGKVAASPATVNMTSETSGDQVYSEGNTVAFDVDMTGITTVNNGDKVRVAIGRIGNDNKIYRFNQYNALSKTYTPINPFVSGLTEVNTPSQSYYYATATVADGKVSVSGTLVADISPASVGVVILNEDGTTALAGIAVLSYNNTNPSIYKPVYFGVENALAGGDIYTDPLLKSLTDLYAVPDISFKKILVDNASGDDVVGTIKFKDLNLMQNWNDIMQLSSALIINPINNSDPTKGFEIGMNASKLTNLSLKPATISVSGIDTLQSNLTVDSFDISSLGLGSIISNKAYTDGTLSFDVNHFSTYKVLFAGGPGPGPSGPSVTLAINGTDADNVYFAGENLSYTVSGLAAYNGQTVRVITGVIDSVAGGTNLTDEKLLSTSSDGSTYWYNTATVADGAVTISGNVVSGWAPSKVMVKILKDDGTAISDPIQLMNGSFYVADGFPVDAGSLTGVKPVKVGLENGIDSSITCIPAINTITDLYNTNITLQKTISGTIVGKISFTGVDFATNEDELLSFVNGIKMVETASGSLPAGKQSEMTIGVKTESGAGQLSAFVGKGAEVKIEGLSTALTADKFEITPETGGNVTNTPTFVGGVLAFDVNHFSDYKVAIAAANITTLNITGLSVTNKEYSGTTSATLTGTPQLVGIANGDKVTLTGSTPVATFADKNVGTGKAVTVTGYTLSGADAAKYTLTQPTGLTANITAKALTISGLTANHKVYDGNTAATFTGGALSGVINGDTVTLSGTPVANFADKNAEIGKDVTLTGLYTLSGTDAGNYTLTQPGLLKADINKKPLTISGLTAVNKPYDSTTTATLSGTATLNGANIIGDVVTLGGTPVATFSDAVAGLNKAVTVTGYTLSGKDADNYTLAQPIGLTANITAKPLTISGLTAVNKEYDGTNSATLSGTPQLVGIAGDEVVTLDGSAAVATFADKNIGNGKAVTVTGYTLSGADAAKYTLTQPTGLTANITAKALTISGLTAVNKPYDGTTTATLSGTATLNGVVGIEINLSGTPVAAFANKNAGTARAVTVNGYTLSGAGIGNYTLTQPTGLTADITPIALMATADSKTKLVGADNPTATITYTGFISSENATNAGITAPTATHTAAKNSAAGTYDINLNGGSGGDNYTLTLVKGTLTVEKPVASITPTTANFDKKLSAQADIAVTMTLNGNTFDSLKMSNNVIADGNYTLAGNILTIKKEYLATLNLGAQDITFAFKDGSGAESTKTITVTVADTTTYNITVSSVANVVITPSTGSASPVAKGGNYSFTVTLPNKYDSSSLVVKTGNTTLTAVSGVYTISNIQADTLISVEANIKTFTVTGTVAGGSGTINPDTKQVAYGESAIVSTLPNTGYEVSTFSVGGVDKKAQLVNGIYTISNITADTAVSVTFIAKQYTVTKTAGTGGSITANATVAHGATLSVTIVPTTGNNVSGASYSMAGVTKTPTLTAGPDNVKAFNITNVTGNLIINATFAPVDKSALLNAISAASLINANAYQDSYKTAFTNALNNAVLVKNNTSSTADQVSAATTALTDATNNLTAANKKTFTVTVISPFNGTASVDKTTPKYGDDVTVTATPNNTYALYKILVNGVQINGNLAKNITADTTITVMFKSTIPAAVTTFRTTHATILGKTVSSVQNTDSADVDNALIAYAGLSADHQKFVASEYQLLSALRTHLDNLLIANNVTSLITALTNDNSMTFVNAVRETNAKYDALTQDQKKLVPMVSVNKLNSCMITADAIYNNNLAEQAKISYVNTLVDALETTIDINGYADVNVATAAYLPVKAAYDALTVAQQAQVTNSGKLTTLSAAILTKNQAAADAVSTIINALTKVDATMAFDVAEGYKKAIIEAKNAYDALTANQKALITTAVKTKLDQCFESVAIVIEKPMPDSVDENLAGGLTFTGISDTITDLSVTTPTDYSGTESTINSALNGGGSDTALRAELILDLTPQNAGGNEQQPDGKVKIRILLGDALRNMRAFLSVVSSHGGSIYSIPCTIVEENGQFYLEFETDRFSTYAIVSEVHTGNSYLSALSASGVTLTPSFNKDTVNYTATVANIVASTTISATKEDTSATMTGTGSKTLVVGSNVFEVVVTADDNSTKTYTITITRSAAGGSGGGNTTTTIPDIGVVNTNKGNITTSTITPTVQTNTTGKATAVLEASYLEQALAQATTSENNKQKAVIAINLAATGTTKAVELEIPRDSFNKIADGSKADVQVKAGIGTITFDANAVETISGTADSGNIVVSINKLEASALTAEIQKQVGDRPVYNLSVKAGSTQISQFGTGLVKISLPYTPKANEKANAIVVYYIDNAGNLKTVRGQYNATTGHVTFNTSHFSNFAIGYNEVNFSDVKDGQWYSNAVDFIAARGITTGTDENNFSPAAKLTRGQFIVMLMKAYGIEADANSTSNFADAGNTYYTNYLAAAKRLGITNGVGDNLYAPNKTCTRQEMFTLVYNALKAIDELPEGTNGKAVSTFADGNQVASWASEALNCLTSTGTIGGVSGNNLDPLSVSTRSQMAQVLYNLLAK